MKKKQIPESIGSTEESEVFTKPLMTFVSIEVSKPAIIKPKADQPKLKKENAPKVTKIGVAMARSEKYYKQFDFFFNRSCFRIMTEFYKDKFNKFYAMK